MDAVGDCGAQVNWPLDSFEELDVLVIASILHSPPRASPTGSSGSPLSISPLILPRVAQTARLIADPSRRRHGSEDLHRAGLTGIRPSCAAATTTGANNVAASGSSYGTGHSSR